MWAVASESMIQGWDAGHAKALNATPAVPDKDGRDEDGRDDEMVDVEVVKEAAVAE